MSVYWVLRRELHVMLRAPIVYLVGGLFLAVQGVAFAGLIGAMSDPRRPAPLGTLLEAQLSGTLLTWILELVVLVLLGMRAIADDKRAGTWELLLTAQVSERAAVIGKWLAAATLYALLWLPTLLYLGVVAHYRADAGGFDLGQVAIGYLGAIALGAALLAWVIAASAATSSSLTAGALGFAALVACFLVGELAALWPGLSTSHPGLAALLAAISPRQHLAALARGEVRLATLVALAGCTVTGLAVATTAACTGRRRARELRLRAIGTLAIAAIVIAASALAIRHPWAWDASGNRRNSLDPETRELLAGAPPTRLTIIAPTLAGLEAIYGEADLVVAHMAEVAPELAVAHVDPASDPDAVAGFAKLAGLAPSDLMSGGAIVVEIGGKSRAIDVFALATVDRNPGAAVVIERLAIEQAITGAIAQLVQAAPITACVTTGHGELPLAARPDQQDWNVVARRLEAEGITVSPLAAGFTDVPCSVAIVAGPTTPLSASEALVVQHHVAAGRGLVVLAASRPVDGALAATGLEGVLAADGLGLPIAIAIDPTLGVREVPGALLVQTGYTDHPINLGFAGKRATLWFQPRPVVVARGARPLVVATTESWGERDFTAPPAKGPDDLAGPIAIAAVGAAHRAIAIGSAESLSSAVLSGTSAADLWFAHAVRWAAGGAAAAPTIASRAPEQVRLVMTDGERRTAIALCVAGIPLAWIALGAVVVWLRRRRA